MIDLMYNGLTSLLHESNRELVETDRKDFNEWCLKNLPLNEKEVRYHPLLTLKSALS